MRLLLGWLSPHTLSYSERQDLKLAHGLILLVLFAATAVLGWFLKRYGWFKPRDPSEP